MVFQVLVVKFGVWIVIGILPDNDSTVMAVDFVMTSVTVIKLRSRLSCEVRISEGCGEINWTLSDERNSIEMRCLSMMESMPVKCRGCSAHMVCYINDDQVILANVNWWTWNFSVNRHHATLNSISSYALFIVAIIKSCVSIAASSTSTLNRLVIRLFFTFSELYLRSQDMITFQVKVEVANSCY